MVFRGPWPSLEPYTPLSVPELIATTILDPLERLLDQYVFTVTTTLPEPLESDDQDEIRSLIQLEAIHVRGEAFQSQLERSNGALLAA